MMKQPQNVNPKEIRLLFYQDFKLNVFISVVDFHFLCFQMKTKEVSSKIMFVYETFFLCLQQN